MARKRRTLDDLLLATGETYDAFAERSGVPRYTLYRLRSGDIEKPRRSTLHRLAAALGVSVEAVRDAIAASRDAAG